MYGLPAVGAGPSIRDLRSALSSRMLHRIVRQKNHRPGAGSLRTALRRGRAIYPIELDADNIDTLQHDLDHRSDVSLRKVDPLLGAEEHEQDFDPLPAAHAFVDCETLAERPLRDLHTVPALETARLWQLNDAHALGSS